MALQGIRGASLEGTRAVIFSSRANHIAPRSDGLGVRAGASVVEATAGLHVVQVVADHVALVIAVANALMAAVGTVSVIRIVTFTFVRMLFHGFAPCRVGGE